jgi:hypothetical protein
MMLLHVKQKQLHMTMHVIYTIQFIIRPLNNMLEILWRLYHS